MTNVYEPSEKETVCGLSNSEIEEAFKKADEAQKVSSHNWTIFYKGNSRRLQKERD